MDPKTGEWTVDFYDNDRQCKAAEVDLQKSHIARQYASYGLIAEDLALLLNWTREYRGSVNAYEREHPGDADLSQNAQVPSEESAKAYAVFSLFTSICIIYGRLFTQHDSGMVTLEKKAHVAPSHYGIHDELMNARHRYIAHRNDKSYEGFKTFLVVSPDNPAEFMIVYQSNRVAFNGARKIQEVIDHLDELSRRIKAKIEALQAKLIEAHQKKELFFLPTND